MLNSEPLYEGKIDSQLMETQHNREFGTGEIEDSLAV